MEELSGASDKALAGRIGAHESWSRTVDRRARTANARKAALARFDAEVPAEITDPVERAQAAEHARKAYFTRLSLKAVQARRKANEAAQAEAELRAGWDGAA
jgi:hypothetical protein